MTTVPGTETVSNDAYPFAMILVFRPRPKRPASPSFSVTSLIACVYEIGSLFVCFVVLMTRRLLLQVSEMTEDVKPMTAFRPNFLRVSSGLGLGIFSCCER